MHLRRRRARLTATEPELILTGPNDFFNLRTHVIVATYLHGRQCQAIGGVVLGAVSDNQYFQATAQPADLGLVGMPPVVPHRVSIEAAILLQATHKIPPIVPNPFQEHFGGIPTSKRTYSGRQRRR
jgi:hypothetical protein